MKARAGLLGTILANPILVREMRILMRGRKLFISHAVSMGALTMLLLLGLGTLRAESDQPDTIGRRLFLLFSLGQALLVTLTVPAFSCTALTTERERKTFDLLITTSIEPWEVVAGKFLAALVLGLLFLCSTIPLLAVTFLFGGVTLTEMLALYGLSVLWTVLITAMSTYISAVCRDSKRAISMTYVGVGGMLGLTTWLLWSRIFEAWKSGLAASVKDLYDSATSIYNLGDWSYVGLAGLAFLFLAAVNRVRPFAGNRSTSLRAWLLVFGTLALGLLMLLWSTESEIDLVRNHVRRLTEILTLVFLLAALLFATEPLETPPSVRKQTLGLFRLSPLRLFYPGMGTGALFVPAAAGVVLFGLFAGWTVADWRDDQNIWSQLPVPRLALLIFVLVAFTALLALLLVSLGLRQRWAAILTALGVAALTGLPVLLQIYLSSSLTAQEEFQPQPWHFHYLSPWLVAEALWSGSAPFADAAANRWSGEMLGLPLWIWSVTAYMLMTAWLAFLVLWRLRKRFRAERREITALWRELRPAPARPAPAAAAAPPAASAAVTAQARELADAEAAGLAVAEPVTEADEAAGAAGEPPPA